MDRKYLENLKSVDLRPRKVRLGEIRINIKEQEARGIDDLHNQIVKWFMEHPSPPDSEVHKFAEQLGVSPDKLERHIYMILSDILSGGKSKNFKGKYDSKELDMGIKIEREHTGSVLIAQKIAKDHLSEIPDYYSRLKNMERAAGIKD